MLPSRFACENTSWKNLIFSGVLLLCLMVPACEPLVNPNTEPPNPTGTGWLVWDSTRFRGTLTDFSVQQNTITFNINGINLDGCVPQTTFTQAKNGNVFTVKAFYKPQDPSLGCTGALTPFTLRVSLPVTSGTYRVYLSPTPISRAFDTTITVP